MTKARDLANSAAAFAAVSATELGYVDGVTSAIQTQMDAKAPSSTAVTLTGTQTLTNKTLTSPVIASVVNNTLTSTTGDIIYASAANTPARLAIGSTSQVLTVTGGVPVWATAAAGGWALITSGSLSSTSTTVSSISGAYTDLRILFRAHRSSTDAAGLYITYNSTDTIYNPSTAFNSTSSDTFGYGNAASTANLVAGNVDNAVYADNTTIIQMPGYSNSSLQKSADVYGNTIRADNPNFNWIMYKSRIGLTAAITSFTISATAGTLSGSYYVYGI